MIKLISLGLWITPFMFIKGHLIKDVQETTAILISLALGLFALYLGRFKFNKKWSLIFVGWCLLSLVIAPKYAVKMMGLNVTGFWAFKPLLLGLCYFMALVAVISVEITKRDLKLLHISLIYPATFSACYILLQHFGFNEFFYIPDSIRALKQIPTSLELFGFQGQPTLTAAFIGIGIPFALSKKKWIESGIMLIALCLIKSLVAIFAIVVSLIWLATHLNKKRLIALWFIFLVAIVALGGKVLTTPQLRNKVISESSGRVEVWKNLIEDCKGNVLIGHGVGSFKYVFPQKHKSIYFEAHNEYLEIFYNVGLVGLVLFGLSIWENRGENSTCNNAIGMKASLLFICISAGGTFVWQLGPVCFYSIVLLGLLNNNFYIGAGGEYDDSKFSG